MIYIIAFSIVFVHSKKRLESFVSSYIMRHNIQHLDSPREIIKSNIFLIGVLGGNKNR